MKIRVLATLMLVAACFQAAAQDYTLQIETDKKIIYVDQLHLPDYVCASEVLQILPEFASRETDLYGNFDIQYDGKSVGKSRDVIIAQTRLQEIEKIEISTSSVSTQQNGAYSGTINFIPRKASDGISGELFFDSVTLPDVMGSANVNFKKNKLTLRGFATIEGCWMSGVKQFERYDFSEYSYGHKYDEMNTFQETARVNVEYRMTDRDLFKGWYMESWQSDNSFTKDVHRSERDMSETAGKGMALISESTDFTRDRGSYFSIYAKGQYEHDFSPESKLKLYAGYEGSPSTDNGEARKNNTFDSEVKYTVPILHIGKNLFSTEVGANVTLTKKGDPYLNVRSTYASPFATLKFESDKWKVELAGRYQHFRRNIELDKKDPYGDSDNDFTANANAIWQFHPHRAFRLMAYRNITRPSDIMIYPGINLDHENGNLVMGNPELEPALIQSVELDYICDWKSKKGHNFTLNLGVGYLNANGLFEKMIFDANDKYTFYVKYVNHGIDNLLTANLAFIFQSSPVTLSFAANAFTNLARKNGVDERTTNCNLSFSPIFNFSNDWMLSGRFMYNSPLHQTFSKSGESIFAQIRFGKKIRRWTVHLEFSDIFDVLTTDESIMDGIYTAYTYDIYKKYIGIGCSYRIGNFKL